MRRAVALAALVLPAAATADPAPEDLGAIAWVRSLTGFPLEIREVGPVAVAPGGVTVADPLIFALDDGWSFIPVPEGPARFIVALQTDTGEVSKALLVFSANPVACGHEETSVGVDSGLAAFLDRPTATALDADARALGPDKDIYIDWFDALIGQSPVVADLVPLPSGPRVPMMSSGWGDGFYPVASLYDAEGRMVALYADFTGIDDAGSWLLPEPCAGPDVTRADLPPFPPSNL